MKIKQLARQHMNNRADKTEGNSVSVGSAVKEVSSTALSRIRMRFQKHANNMLAHIPDVQELWFSVGGKAGIVDTGASKCVIGSAHISDLVQSLPQHVQKQTKKKASSITFRFWNNQTLESTYAILPFNPHAGSLYK